LHSCEDSCSSNHPRSTPTWSSAEMLASALSTIIHNDERRAHQGAVDNSEYPSECDKRRSFISGFTGSAGEFAPCLIRSLPKISYKWAFLNRDCDRNNIERLPVYRWAIPSAGLAGAGFVRRSRTQTLCASNLLIRNWTLMKEGLKGISSLYHLKGHSLDCFLPKMFRRGRNSCRKFVTCLKLRIPQVN